MKILLYSELSFIISRGETDFENNCKNKLMQIYFTFNISKILIDTYMHSYDKKTIWKNLLWQLIILLK